jgi:ClpP class serine protease
MLTDKYLLLSESFATDYISRIEHFTNPANAGKIDDYIHQYYEGKVAECKDIYHFDGVDAHIRIVGPMSPEGPDPYDLFYGFGGVSYVDILAGIAQAKKDVNPSIGKLYLDTDTPGGAVSMVDKVYQALVTCGLTTIMVNDGLVASGGMWLGAACDKIVASTPVAFAGSIGVVVNAFDISGMLEQLGVKRIVITNHEASEKIPDISTEAGRKVVQEELAAIYRVFKERVVSRAGGGKISAETIDNLKGSVKVAAEAVKLGLIDEIRDLSTERPGGQAYKPRAQANASPAAEGAKAMNVEQLKAEHPDLVAAIEADACEGMVTKEDAENQKTEAVKAEGESIMALVTASVGEAAAKKISMAHSKGLTAEDLSEMGVSLAAEPAGETTEGQMLTAITNAAAPGVKVGVETKQTEADQRKSVVSAIAAGGNR